MTYEEQQTVNAVMRSWSEDWNKFVRDALGARLDKEQQDIVSSVQRNPRTAVASGTARGKDFVTACVALAFLYLTPRFDENGTMVSNTKIALTAPTGRQVSNIMTPEIRRLLRTARDKFPFLFPGRLVGDDIRTPFEEWFLTGFKADDNATEAWTGFHASNTMFCITEASGISEKIFNAIEGNLQGNSRLLIVFNPNVSTGYAARAMKSERFAKFRLNSLNAENVRTKKSVIPGQVDYEWVSDKVTAWCNGIDAGEALEEEGDFLWEGRWFRPNDLFRVKVLGLFPKVSEDCLIPLDWVLSANERWKERKGCEELTDGSVGVDVAGMGRDSSVVVPRFGNYVPSVLSHQSGGKADHMHVAGMVAGFLRSERGGYRNRAFIDTIGEGAGVFSRLCELDFPNVFSCKFSEGAARLHDVTGQMEFANMRAYCYWALRDWLNPRLNKEAMLPPDDRLTEELTEVRWAFRSDGKVAIEPKEDIKARLKRSPDYMDALANTFYPYHAERGLTDNEILEMML